MANNHVQDGFFIKGKDGQEIFVYCWEDVSNPKAVVQIFHGMAEHAGRYKEFAQYLNSRGFIVYADDHRGHGRTAGTVDQLGCIGGDGFNNIVNDEHVIKEFIQKKHKGLGIIILGHSFGSFVAQEYIMRYGRDIVGVILCGSAKKSGIDVGAGKILAYFQKSISGEDKKSKLLDFLSFGNNNKRIKDSKCKSAWLSTDKEAVKKFDEDPFCGTIFTAGFYYYFLKGLSQLYIKERLQQIPSSLPVFIIAGEEDPVGNYGKSVRKLHEIYTKRGIKDARLKLYKGQRHEILNEINRKKVFSDVARWIDEIILK